MRKGLIVLCTCVLLLTGMSPYDRLTVREGEIIADRLNVRTGPGITYPVITSQGKYTKLRILGSLKNWLVVLMPDDSVGMVFGQYVRPVEPEIDEYESPAMEDTPPPAEFTISESERLLLLINHYRHGLGLIPYISDERLSEAARLKALDMVENKYFSHSSPVYGTPFTMLRSMGVFYKTASADLAHTADVSEAFEKMADSLVYRANLVSKRYTNIGIATADDPDEAGKIFIVLFFTEV